MVELAIALLVICLASAASALREARAGNKAEAGVLGGFAALAGVCAAALP